MHSWLQVSQVGSLGCRPIHMSYIHKLNIKGGSYQYVAQTGHLFIATCADERWHSVCIHLSCNLCSGTNQGAIFMANIVHYYSNQASGEHGMGKDDTGHDCGL